MTDGFELFLEEASVKQNTVPFAGFFAQLWKTGKRAFILSLWVDASLKGFAAPVWIS
jgi:hypothetical protein